jgi:RNA 2',3'-cyclic 3'-phosphodiesterase
VRLFVALPLPEETRTALAHWSKRCGACPELRWTPTEQLHITLSFLGEVAEEKLEPLRGALGAIEACAFGIEFQRIETLGRAAVLAAAAKLTPAFARLAESVAAAVRPFVVQPEEDRAFRPHVTLARARRGAAVSKHKSLPPLPPLRFSAECFRLCQSKLTSEGAVHTMIREWKLKQE